MQNNTSSYSAKRKMFQRYQINCMPLPASSDINPIKNLWTTIKQNVYLNRKPIFKQRSFKSNKTVSSRVNVETVEKLTKSLM